MLDKIFIFDIETIADIDSARNLLNLKDSTEAEVLKELALYHNSELNPLNVFFKPPFHKVVAISFMILNIENIAGYEYYHLEELRSGGTLESSEADLVKGFFAYLNKLKPKLVSFNGRGFDLPVLKYRALKHKISSGELYKLGDKWNSYQNRYSENWHTDLLELLSDYNASGKIRLNEVCAISNLPGKIDVDGSSVYELYKSGSLQEIRDYCETDVLNTYLVYLRYVLHTGRINLDGFNHAEQQIVDFLEKHHAQNHFAKFLEVWQKLG